MPMGCITSAPIRRRTTSTCNGTGVLTALLDALKGLAAPIRAMLVALLGAWGASLWFSGTRWAVVVVAIGAVLVALLVDSGGRHSPPNKPLGKIELMEWWVVVPMVLAASAAAVAIIVTVALTVPDGTAAATKETIGAVATAITAFLSAAFVDRIGDEDNSLVSDRIRDHFYEIYKSTFKVGSPAELYVYAGSYGGATGWGRAARRIRAKGIADRWAQDHAT
jgi:hypothetical protein